MVTIHLERGELEAARAQWASLTSQAPGASAYAVAAARLEAAERAAGLPAADELAARIAADPADLSARLDLAEVHVAARAYAAALEQLLEIVKRDRTFRDDVGRRKMLAVFEMADADTVSDYRRRLSSALY
jgi:putative thioredoxin